MNRKFVSFLAMVLLLGSAVGSVHAELVGHWRFNEGAGTVAYDTSGNDNDGILRGNPTWVAGTLGGALQLDGVGDFVEIPHAESLTVNSEVTVAAWINASQLGGPNGSGYAGIVAKSNGPRSYSLYLQSDGLLHFSTAGVGSTSSQTVPLNEWIHVAAQVVAGEHRYFLNGEPAGTGGGAITLPGTGDAANVVIGRTWETDREFMGRFDDVRIYNEGLDQAAVETSMQDIAFGAALATAPADGAMIGQTQYTLKWKAGDFATSHVVYFGESFEAVNAGAVDPIATTEASRLVTGLVPGQTYYWRVDEVAEGHPDSPWRGDVWSFTVQPLTAWNPLPADGGQFVTVDADLTWSGGMGVIFHTVFFGRSLDEVSSATDGDLMTADATYDPGAMEPGTTYYWRVDEFTGAATNKGPVWSFTTMPEIVVTDPHLLGWWKFDEGLGNTATDWSGHANHGTLFGNPQWVDGLYGGALEFAVGKYVNCGADAAADIANDFTLAAWVRLSPGNAGAYAGIGGRLTLDTNYYGFSLVRHSGNAFRLWVGDGTADLAKSAVSSDLTYTDTEWHHVAGVREGLMNTLFVDGVLQAGSTSTGFVPSEQWFHIGRQYSHLDDRYFVGAIDEVRVYDVASTEARIAEIMTGDPVLARQPEPANGMALDIRNVADLTWTAADDAVSHDVYFGTDRQAVAGADRDSAAFVGNQAGASLSLDDLVAFGGGDYFWRVDEVRANGTIAKGYVWRFTVPAYLIVDDFESYTDVEDERIYQTWIDGLTNGDSTSIVGYEQAPFAEQALVNSGRQSMPMDYDNANAPYFAEAQRSWTTAQNWTVEGVDTLSLSIRGKEGNGPGSLFVVLEDNTGKTGVAVNADAQILTTESWTEWRIPLADSGVKATAIKKIYVGVGNRTTPAPGGAGRIYVDDIRVVKP